MIAEKGKKTIRILTVDGSELVSAEIIGKEVYFYVSNSERLVQRKRDSRRFRKIGRYKEAVRLIKGAWDSEGTEYEVQQLRLH